jgi:hypothetical protein
LQTAFFFLFCLFCRSYDWIEELDFIEYHVVKV